MGMIKKLKAAGLDDEVIIYQIVLAAMVIFGIIACVAFWQYDKAKKLNMDLMDELQWYRQQMGESPNPDNHSMNGQYTNHPMNGQYDNTRNNPPHSSDRRY